MRTSISSWCRTAAVLLIGVACAGAAAGEPREAWYQAVVDHRDSGLTVLVLRREDGETAMRQIDLAPLEIAPPAIPGRRHEGELFYPISSLEDYSVSFDDAHGRMICSVALRAGRCAGACLQAHDAEPIADPRCRRSEPAAQPDEEGLVDVVVNGQRSTALVLRARGRGRMSTLAVPAAGVRPVDAREWIALEELVGDNFILATSGCDRTEVPAERFAAPAEPGRERNRHHRRQPSPCWAKTSLRYR